MGIYKNGLLKTAAREISVDRATLRNRANGLHGKEGGQPYLNETQEGILAQLIYHAVPLVQEE